ncbi:MAG: TetR/AcrR family transcriptional regulator [Streptosporangiaceae bacterium]
MTFRRLPWDQRREEIIAAAIEVFQTAQDASLEDIAKAAGSSRSSVYRYFDNKQDLFQAAFQQVASALAGRLAEVPPGVRSARLAEQIHRYFDFVEEYRVGFTVMLSWGAFRVSEETREVAGEVRGQVCQMVYDSLEIAEPGPFLVSTVHSWIAGVESATVGWLRDPGVSRLEVEPLVAAQLGGMLVAAATFEPVIAERLTCWVAAEPHDGLFAAQVRTLTALLTPGLIADLFGILAHEG